jgi:hypothetical protein
MKLTPKQIARLEDITAEHEAATEGPYKLSTPHWHKGCVGFDCKQSITAGSHNTIAVVFGAQYRRRRQPDEEPNDFGYYGEPSIYQIDHQNSVQGEFLAHSWQSVKDLLEMVTQLQQHIDELEGKPVETVEYEKHEYSEEGCKEHKCCGIDNSAVLPLCNHAMLMGDEEVCGRCAIIISTSHDCYFSVIESEETK